MIAGMDLNEALGQFDIVEANLRRLEKVWEEMSSLIYDQGPILGVRDERRYEALRRAYGAIASKLPTIDGSRLDGYPADSDEVAQHQFQARELSEPEGYIYADQVIHAPSKALDDYRFRFDSARRELVRERMGQLMREVDDLLARLLEWVAENNEPVVDSDWSRLKEVISEIDRLAGDVTPRKGRWSEMSRHLSFGQGFDVHDIANLDWPSVRADIEAGMYSELEPLPVEVDDLTSLVNTKPAGPVSTKLAWSKLDAEDFERLLFNIVAKAEGYENARWLTRTNAPDRGRDISVDRVLPDALSGVARQRVIIQAKHWLAKSISPMDVTQALSTISLWEPPLVNVLIIATSGRFTSDAVAVMEKHNSEGNRPIIEPWPESHLESLLAERPHLVAEFRLRSPHS
jgi:hypothetical protein